MTKARDLANLISASSPIAAGTIEVTNISDLTATATELNYVDGVTAAIQTQLDAKVATADVGVTVQPYDATILNSADIGSSVLAYDANLQSFTSAFTLPTSDGTTGQVLTTNGAGSLQLSDLPPSGPTLEAVASGSLSDGSTVVLNADGTVSVVSSSETDTPQLGSVSSEATNTRFYYSMSVYLPDQNAVVVAYADGNNSYYGKAVVGSISGSTITFNSPVQFYGNSVGDVDLTYDPTSSCVIIAFRGASNYLYTVSGLVSSGSISFGSVTTIESRNCNYISIEYYPTEGSYILAYGYDTSVEINVRAISYNGTTYSSAGTRNNLNYENGMYVSLSYRSSDDMFCVFYTDVTNGERLCAIAFTVSGTSISHGTPITIGTSNGSYASSTLDQNSGNFVAVFAEGGTAGRAVVVSCNSSKVLTAGSTVDFYSTNSPAYLAISSYGSTGRVLVAYYESGGNFDGVVVTGTITGTSISFGTKVVFGNTAYFASLAHDTNNDQVVMAYYLSGVSYGRTVIPYELLTNLTSENFVGISDGAYSDTQTATIQLVGSVDDAQTGLTAGSKYYVQKNGSLSTTADTPSVYAGLAASSTKLIVKG